MVGGEGNANRHSGLHSKTFLGPQLISYLGKLVRLSLLVTSSGLHHKNILMIVSDDHKWCLPYKYLLAFAWALASVINYARKWCHNFEHHLLMILEFQL